MRALWLLPALACSDPEPAPVPEPTYPFTTPTPPGTLDTSLPPYEMSGFSFVDEHLAGMPQPGRIVPLEQDLAFLVEQDLSLLVSLTVTATNPTEVAEVGLDLLHLPIVDFTPPSYEQQLAFVDEMWLRVAAGEKVGVHDTAGLGRCGTMLATWFVAKGMASQEAIDAIRALRPGSIETDEQEQAIHAFDAMY